METLSSLAYGFSVILQPALLVFIIFGVIFGVVIGALPGLGPSAGMAILLPLTYGMNPLTGIAMMTGIYYGAMYGGSITSITINTPGDSAAVMTTLDGYPMAKKGQAGKALGMAAIASITGGTIAIIIYTFFAPWLAGFATRFGPPEYFGLMLLGLTAVGGLASGSANKTFLATVFGLFLATVGLDGITGNQRFTFGVLELYEGLNFVPIAMGLFGIAEIMSLDQSDVSIKVQKQELSFKKQLPTKEEAKICAPHIARSTALGFFIGMLPGAGGTIATFLAYGLAKKTSKRGEKFGTGVIEGIAAPEAANNAASIGAMVPLITLGVPGSASTSIMLGALMMFGLRPGPLIFQSNPDFAWGLTASMYASNVILVIIAMTALPLIVRILGVKKPILNSVVIAFILVGAYCLNFRMFDVGITILFGILGFVFKKIEFPVAPIILALVLGNMVEINLRRSLIMFRGDILGIFTRPIAAVFFTLAIIALLLPVIRLITDKISKPKINES